MTKHIIASLLTFILILAIPAQAVSLSLPVKGTINFSLNIRSGAISASFDDTTVTSDATIDIERAGDLVGSLRLQVRIEESSSGSFNLSGEARGTADIGLDAVNDVIRLNSLSWQLSSDVSSWKQIGGATTRSFTFSLNQDGAKGQIVADARITQTDEGRMDYDLVSNGNKIGTITIESNVEVIFEDPREVTNSFAGFVTDASGRPVTNGTVKILAGTSSAIGQIIPLSAGKAGYGLNNSPLTVTETIGTTVLFFIGEKLVANTSITTATEVRRVDLVNADISTFNFQDKDLDGVPDSSDKCPNSQNSQVDSDGCTCEQVLPNMPGLTCSSSAVTGPAITPSPPPPVCETVKECLDDKPTYCNAEKQVVHNCGECGCPEGFQCAADDQFCPDGEECINDGGCYKAVDTIGLKCLTNDYRLIPLSGNCSLVGPTFYDFFANDPFHRSLPAFIGVRVEGGFFGVEKSAKKQMQRMLTRYKICIDTVDLGCVPSDVRCPGEDAFIEHKSNAVFQVIAAEVQNVFGEREKKTDFGASMLETFDQIALGGYLGIACIGPQIILCAIIGVVVLIVALIGAGFFSDVSVEFFLRAGSLDTEIAMRMPYSCPASILSSNISCSPHISNGDSEGKIDILIIGEGFADKAEFNTTIAQMLDYKGNNTGKRTEGVFSREPFKKNKERFNVWTIYGNDQINYTTTDAMQSAGKIPDLKDIYDISQTCPQRDFTIVVSKKTFRSHCGQDQSQPCYLSLSNEPFAGRQLLRLLGKHIGKLEDEYYFEMEFKDRSERIEPFDNFAMTNSQTTPPNCKLNLDDAKKGWGQLRTVGKIVGYFEGCGGECGPLCKKYYRPTSNSILNQYDKRCLGEGNATCRQGPPFDPFYIVNEQAILKAFEDLGSEQEEPEENVTAASMEDETPPPPRNTTRPPPAEPAGGDV